MIVRSYTVALLVVLLPSFATEVSAQSFIRADVDASGTVDIADPISTLVHLFGGTSGACLDALDGNDDGAINIADPIFVLAYLFNGGDSPPSPFPECGIDPTTDNLGCANTPALCAPLPTGTHPWPMTRHISGVGTILPHVADVDGDGIADLLAMYPEGVVFARGLGGPRFQESSIFPGLVDQPWYAEFGDVNGDGNLDGVLQTSVGIHYFEGNGDGTFDPPVASAALAPLLADATLRIGDLNGDGLIDAAALAVLDQLQVWIGNGAGGFTPLPLIPFARNGQEFVLADVDQDLDLDIVTRDQASSDRVALYFNDGTGGFSAPTILTDDFVEVVVVADIDEDTIPDLITSGGAQLGVHLGLGNGQFQPVVHTQSFTDDELEVGDWDEDNHLDVIAERSGGGIQILYGTGQGTFESPEEIWFPDVQIRTIDFDDSDGDGHGDLLCAVSAYDTLSTLIHWGEGTRNAPAPIEVPSADPIENIDWVESGDFDEDGLDDLLEGDGEGVHLHLSLGGGAFAPPSTFGFDGFFLLVEDLDADGHLDVIDRDVVHLGSGLGTFGPPFPPGPVSYFPSNMVFADVDQNGILDAVQFKRGFMDELQTYFGAGDGTFTFGVASPVPATPSQSWTLGDLNLDGVPDTVHSEYNVDLIQVYLGTATGSFAPGPSQAVGDDTLSPVEVVDLDHDGINDLVLVGTDGLAVAPGVGDGTFLPLTLIETAQVSQLEVEDINLDGHLDFVTFERFEDRFRVFLGDGMFSFEPAFVLPQVDESQDRFALGDFDGDGDLDIVGGGSDSEDRLIFFPNRIVP